MFSFKVLPLVLLIQVAAVLGLQQSFLFTQCDCLADFTAIPIGTGTALSNLQGSGVECPIGANTGFIRDFGLGEGDLSFSIAPEFFIDGADRNTWFMFFDISMEEAVDGETYKLGDFGFPVPFSLEISLRETNIVAKFVGINADNFRVQRVPGDRYQVFLFESTRLNTFSGRIESQLGVDLLSNFVRLDSIFQSESSLDDSVTGNVEDFVDPVNIKLLNGNNQGKILLKMVALSDQVDDGLDTFGGAIDNINDLVLDFPNKDVEALPLFNTALFFSTIEDTVLDNGSVSAAFFDSDVPIEISFDEEVLNGDIVGFDDLTGDFVSYTPAADDFGEDILRLTYNALDGELPYECALTVDVAIEITAVEDIPVVIEVDPLAATTFVDVVFAVPVAESVDFPDDNNILQEGSVVIQTLPEEGDLKQSDCITPINVDDVIDIVDGLFTFCFQGVVLGGGPDQTFSYNVLPPSGAVENQAVDLGTITLVAASPISINQDSNTRSVVAVEDVESFLIIDSETFFNVDPGFDGLSLVFGMTILSLPDPSVGIITDFVSVPVEVGDVFLSIDILIFVPAANFFNTNEEGGIENEDGDIVFEQDCEVDERVGDACPDVFSYALVFFTDEQDDTVFEIVDQADFGLIVTAVNDENPELLSSPEDLPVDFDDDENVALIFANSDEFEVANDNGANIFTMGVRFIGNDGAVIQSRDTLESDPQVVGFNSIEDADNGENNDDCLAVGCVVLDVIGTPARVNAFLSELQFGAPNDVITNATISVALSGDGVFFGNGVEDIPFTVFTDAPTFSPTFNPTVSPTLNPTFNPTVSPTLNPTFNPTVSPTFNPTFNPTVSPTLNPTLNPTFNPTTSPTLSPTITIEVDDDGLEAGAIGGIVVGVVVFLGILVIVPVVLGKKQEKVESAAEDEKQAKGDDAKIKDEV